MVLRVVLKFEPPQSFLCKVFAFMVCSTTFYRFHFASEFFHV